MTAAPPLATAALYDALGAALARRGEPVLLRISRPIAPTDPLAHYARALDRGDDPVVYWRERDLTFIALGALDADALPLHIDGAAPAPRVIFAHRFEPDAPRERIVPRCVISARPATGEHWITVHARVTPATDLAAARAALAAAWATATADLPPPALGAPHDRAPTPEEPRAAWIDRVGRLRDACRDPDDPLCKVVPARAARYTAPLGQRFDPPATLAALAAAEPDACVFAFTRGGATFLGATPERLARRVGDGLDTHALAGTAARAADPAADAARARALLESAKDRHEHAVVVDAIVAALAPIANVTPGELAPVRLGALWHLETPIAARLAPGRDLFDAIDALHPTPALGGHPRARARAALADEPLRRGHYAAPIGWVDPHGDGLAAVAIRSATLTATTARAFAGAGVVAESDPAAEWDETALKLATIGRALRLVPAAPAREAAR